MKKQIVFILLSLIGVIAYISYLLILPCSNFSEKSSTFIIEEGKTDKEDVINTLEQNKIIKNVWAFSLVANQLNIWRKLKPGKYEIKQNDNILTVVKMLRKNKQVEAKLIINKIRTREDLARLIGKNFSTDSISVVRFLSSNDSLAPFSVDTNTVMNLIIPNTYTFYWGTSVYKILLKLQTVNEQFWNKNDRLQKANALGFSPKDVYTIASIVEEETNMNEDKGKIASVYINRFHQGMNLGADPTVKFALKNFLIKRVLFNQLKVESPFNTYMHKGLPPGAICTPSISTIDAVLNAPTTNYLYFVAKSDFSGYSNFSSNFTQHSIYAKQYQQALDNYHIQK